MKRIELNREGNFERWHPDHLNELKTLNQVSEEQDCILLEDLHTRLRLFGMEPYERIPFRILPHSFTLFCLTGGTAITRSCKGTIDLMIFEPGESVTQPIERSAMINDLQNMGEEPMVLAILEHLKPISYGDWVDWARITSRTPRTK